MYKYHYHFKQYPGADTKMSETKGTLGLGEGVGGGGGGVFLSSNTEILHPA